MRRRLRPQRCGRWLLGVAVWFGLVLGRVSGTRAADPPVVEIFGGAGSNAALALLRGELEVLGFVVKPRPLASSSELPGLPWIYGRVVMRAADRAQAEVQVYRPRARADQTSTIDLGALDGLSESDRNRVLTTLAVRVAELLRALDVQPRPPRDEPVATSPAPVLEPEAPRIAPPAAARPSRSESATVKAQPASAKVVPVVHAPERIFVAPGPFSAEAGIAMGSALDTGAAALGPVLRFTWHLPAGLLVGATVTSLTSPEPLVGAAGQSSLVHAVALAQFGYRGQVWGGRLLPEITVGFGAQHLRARGETFAPNEGVVDELVGFAAALGAGLGFRLADAWVVGAHLDLYRAFPQATVFIGPDAVGEALDVAGFASLTLRYLF
ncbi:MAG TPA: hypothetical protein VGG33_15025 [Polyangia bacterium]